MEGWSGPMAWALAHLALANEGALVDACSEASRDWTGDDPALYLEALQEALVPRLLDLWLDTMPLPVATSVLHEVGHWFAQTRTQTVTQAQLRSLSAACWEGEQ